MNFNLLHQLTTVEVVFVFLMCGAAFLYLHFLIDYSWNNKQLHILKKDKNLELIPFSFWGAMVSIFTIACLVTGDNEYLFTTFVVFLLLSVVWARFYYFKSVSKLLESKRLDKGYKWLTLFYSVITFIFLFYAWRDGYTALFDITKPTSVDSGMRHAMIPYELSNLIKGLFIPNYLFCQVAFLYFIYKGYKRGEKLIVFGATFTMLAILYTNSYQVFQWKYWMPLNVIADLFELFRLNYVQRKNIQEELVELAQKDLQYRILRHDLGNSIFISYLCLNAAKKEIEKEDYNPDKLKELIDRAYKSQEMTKTFFIPQDQSKKVIDLEELIQKISTTVDIPVYTEGVMLKEIIFNNNDIHNVLINLIKNAKEANCKQIDPWVKLYIEERDGFYHFKVQDSGEYINIPDPKKLFERGFSTKEKEGRGLGLYSVKQIIEKHAGKINITDLDGYTCFYFNVKK